MKLGKLDPKWHPRTIPFAKIISPGALPSPATKVYREYKTPDAAKQMYGNDQYGDCVWAMIANFIILTTAHTGSMIVPTLDDVLKAYAAVTGFDRVTGANDNGTVMTDAFEYMRTVGMAGVKFLAWAQIDHTNLVHRKLGADLFGATMTGVKLRAAAQEQFAAGGSFELVPASPVEGGHAILRPGYGSLGDDYVTWAKWDQKASAAWSADAIDEEYVVVTSAWINQVTQKTPGGLALSELLAYTKSLSA
jgi:hypothetical protein